MCPPVQPGLVGIDDERRMKMKKRLLSLALSLALCTGLTVPVSAAKVPHIITWLDMGMGLIGDG